MKKFWERVKTFFTKPRKPVDSLYTSFFKAALLRYRLEHGKWDYGLREFVSVNDVIFFMNSLIEIDQKAITALVNSRVLCDEELANHYSVQVGWPDHSKKEYLVGILGIFNGIFGKDAETGHGPISVMIDDDTQLVTEFKRTDFEYVKELQKERE